MIDWLTVRVPGMAGCVCAGHVMSVDADGVVEWISEKRAEAEGSHSARCTLRNFAEELEISGNPAKFWQGHNVFGAADLPAIARAFVARACDAGGIFLTDAARAAVEAGDVVLTRVDLTESFMFGDVAAATEAVKRISEVGYLKHRGRGTLFDEGSVYFGKASRRMLAKAYAKGRELRRNRLPVELAQRDEVEGFADGLVRVEFQLRAMWLKDRGLRFVRDWSGGEAAARELHAELVGGLNLSEARMRRDDERLRGLRPSEVTAFDAWRTGRDLRALYPRTTFYRLRRRLMGVLGVDIALVQPVVEDSAPASERLSFEGRRVDVPEWAKGTPAYFDPAEWEKAGRPMPAKPAGGKLSAVEAKRRAKAVIAASAAKADAKAAEAAVSADAGEAGEAAGA